MTRGNAKVLAVAVATCVVFGCGNDGGSTTPTNGGSPPVPTGPPTEAEMELLNLLQAAYPMGTRVAGPGEDDSVDVASNLNSDPLARAQLNPGENLTIQIGFTSPNNPVDAVCVAFGSPQNAFCVPANSPGVTTAGDGNQGALGLDVPISAALCGMLSQICHDIRCYEFARTSAGTFSRANINLLAAACGNCDEPSCQSLLGPECQSTGSQCTPACAADETCVDGVCVGEGALRFTLRWSTSQSDLDLHVITPASSEIDFTNPSADGGTLDVDNTIGGPGSVENVVFPMDPPRGVYQYFVDHFSGPSADYTLEAFINGQRVNSDSGNVQPGGESSRLSLTF